MAEWGVRLELMSNSDKKRGNLLKPHLWLIRLIGVIVPRRLRVDWRQEWEAELHHRELLLSEWDRLNLRNKLNLLWRSTSAFLGCAVAPVLPMGG
jgi:hypothetical protein